MTSREVAARFDKTQATPDLIARCCGSWQRLVGWAIAVSMCISSAHGQETSSAPDQLTKISGETVHATVSSIDANGIVKLADGGQIELAQLVRIERSSSKSAPSSAPFELRLTTGGILYATAVSVAKERAHVTTNFGAVDLPIESIRAIIFQRHLFVEEVGAAISQPSKELDTILAQTDSGLQSAAGLIGAIDSRKISGEFDGQPREIVLTKVVAVVTADLDLSLPTGNTATLDLIDGSSIRGAILSLEGGVLALEPVAGGLGTAVELGGKHFRRLRSARLVVGFDAG